MNTIIILAGVPYNYLKQRPQHFAAYFANQGYEVMYIGITDFTRIDMESLNAIHDRHSLMKEAFKKNKDGVLILKNSVVKDSISSSTLTKLMNKIFELYSDENLAYIVSFPEWMIHLHDLPPKSKLIYDCLDDWESFSNEDMGYSDDLLYNERRIASIAKLVITSAKRLYVKMSYFNNNLYYLPNGVWNSDYDKRNFNRVPRDLVSIKKPIVFFMGAIAEWVDINLIKYITESRPNYSFVFVGHTKYDLPELSNIYFLGSKEYDELPRYLEQSRVAIIPFKENNLTAAVTPLKFYEYLGSSTPTVTTIMPDILGLEGSKTATNYEEFVSYLDYYINLEESEYDLITKKAKSTADMFDWSHLLEPLIPFIEEGSMDFQKKDVFIRETTTEYKKYHQNFLIKNELLSLYNYLELYDSSCALYNFGDVISTEPQVDYEKLALAYIKSGSNDKAVQLLNLYIKTSNNILLKPYIDSLLIEEEYRRLIEIFLLKISGNTYEALHLADRLTTNGNYNPKLLGLLCGLYLDIGEYDNTFELIINVLREENEHQLQETFDVNTLSFLVRSFAERERYDLAEEVALTLMSVNKDWEAKAIELLSNVYISRHIV